MSFWSLSNTFHRFTRRPIVNEGIQSITAQCYRIVSTESKLKRKVLPVVPTMETARAMPRDVRQASNDVLVMLAYLRPRVKDARAEMLRRHIMAVDNVPYDQAERRFRKIQEANRRNMFFHTIPSKVGFAMAVVAGFSAFPLVFDIDTVKVFNELYVTANVPEPEDLETPLEVGSWSWDWMEPPLGTISFFLLCLQFARSQLQNLGLKPFSAIIKQKRADRLVRSFPQYDAKLLRAYSKSDNYY